MYIIRNNEKFELTADEIYEAHKEFVISWMTDTAREILTNSYNLSVSDSICDRIADEAYDIYSKGDGDTEYESVEKAVANYIDEAIDCE